MTIPSRPPVHRLAQLIHDANHAYPLSVPENAEWCARVILACWPNPVPAPRDLLLTPLPAHVALPWKTIEGMC